MFEIGRTYRITTGIGDAEGYSTYDVIGYEAPLLKVTGAGQETIFNTCSPSFVSAEKVLTDEEEQTRWTDFPEHLLPESDPPAR